MGGRPFPASVLRGRAGCVDWWMEGVRGSRRQEGRTPREGMVMVALEISVLETWVFAAICVFSKDSPCFSAVLVMLTFFCKYQLILVIFRE